MLGDLFKWTRGPGLPTWYDARYRLPLSALEGQAGVEPRRADFAAWYLLEAGAIRDEDLRAPARASYDDLARVHTADYLESLSRPETLGRIFAVDPSDVPVDEALATVRLACGATLAAARESLSRDGPCLNLLGGFHHAAPDHGGGLCAVNDIAVAIAALRAEGFVQPIAVIDLDAHPPDGTAACLRADAGVFIGSLSGSDWGQVEGADETLLPPGASDDVYLDALEALLGRMPTPRLAFVIAGGDVLAGDRLGRLGLTLDGARRRDLRVLRALDGIASVWVPGGGYHAQAWRVLAGTGLALAQGSRKPIPEKLDPLSARFSRIASGLRQESLGGNIDFTAEEMEEALGLHRGHKRLLLGCYSAEGIEYALFQYGLLAFIRRLGYSRFRVELTDASSGGERAELFGTADGKEHLLIDLAVERKRVAGAEMLYVHWLSLRNPRAHFGEHRPQLPGQEVPGLGLAREMGELLARMAQRLGLDGVAYCPAWFHTAYAGRYRMRFADPARQGRFEALLRDLKHVPLLEASLALADGRVRMNGAPYKWEPDELVFWLEPRPDEEVAATAAERERVKFTVER